MSGADRTVDGPVVAVGRDAFATFAVAAVVDDDGCIAVVVACAYVAVVAVADEIGVAGAVEA